MNTCLLELLEFLRILVMVNEIRTLYSCGLNKGFNSKFSVGFRVWQETPEESWRTHQLKRCKYSNKDEDNSQNFLNDKGVFVCVIAFIWSLPLFCSMLVYHRYTNANIGLWRVGTWLEYLSDHLPYE